MNEELNSKAQQILSSLGEDVVLPGISDEDIDFYDAVAVKLGPAVAELFSLKAKRRIVLEVEDTSTPESTSSYIGGHPFVSAQEEFSWPLNEVTGEPLVFLMQVNFAEFPKLDGYPESGLLQWWIRGDDDTYGLEFGSSATGKEGILIKYYPADELRPSAAKPEDSIPNGDSYDALGPLIQRRPFKLIGKTALSFPGYEDSSVSEDELEVFNEAREILDNDEDEDRAVVDKFTDSDTQIGGYPSFVQGDPRYSDDRPKDLILQLESVYSREQEIIMWGDSGNAQLFGDLEELKRGDTSSLWWDWACY